MKKRVLSLMLAALMTFGLAAPAMAYSTPDFSDVPPDHWAYEPVMKMADAGVIKGTGAGIFSPEMKLSAEMFVVLVGRVVFPDVKAEEADWSGPYVTEAKAKGLLEGTNITDSNLKGDISRYDMAMILAKCVELLKVSATKADNSKVTDYGELPTKYVDAVLMAYGSGLIRGDQSGNFNGANSMTRQEAATVMDRLMGLIPGGTTTEPDPEKPEKSEQPAEPEMYHTVLSIKCYTPEAYEENSEGERPLYGIPVQLRYTEDGGKTSQLIAECISYVRGTYDFVSLETDIDKVLVDNESGQFYFSAETTYEGQKLVSQDLRTDGRATIIPVDVVVPEGLNYKRLQVELVPPTGFKRNVTIEGRVRSNAGISEAMPNITIDLVLYRNATTERPSEDDIGIVLASTISDENGDFLMETALDTLDYFRTTGKKWYRLEGHGEFDGKEWVSELPWRLESMSELTSLEEWLRPSKKVQMKPK